jgi:hypothetical protein
LRKSRKILLGWILLATFGCEKPHAPCSKTLETLPLPVTFDISKKNVLLGKLTVNEDGSLHLDASSKATPEEVTSLQNAVKRMSDGPTVSYMYNERTKDAHYSCSGEVPQGTPQFADGVRWALYSVFYDVDVSK